MEQKAEFTDRREYQISLAVIVLITGLTYGSMLPSLGFYRDDWYQLWAGINLGAESIITLFSIDRPVMGYLYSFTFSIFGDHPLNWQLYALFLRLLAGIFLLWVVRRLWPSLRWQTTAIVVLFIVYPGFLQQPNANTFSNQLFGYTMSILSMGLTIGAVLAKGSWRKGIYTVLAMISALSYWLIYEYMIGMEGFRIAIIWLLADRNTVNPVRRRITFIVRAWLPYVVVGTGYLVWRVFIFESIRQTTSIAALAGMYANDPFRMALQVLTELGKDLLEIPLFGWFIPTYRFISRAPLRDLILSLLMAFLGVSVIVIYRSWLLRRYPKEGSADDSRERVVSRNMLLLGSITVLSTILPVVIAGRDAHWHSGFDRYTLHVTVGVSLLVIGLIHFALRSSLRPLIIYFLVGLSIITHFGNAIHWRDFWRAQTDLWWQLSWRAPLLDEGTVLIVQIPVDGFIEDYEIWGPANLIYHPGQDSIGIVAEVLSEETAEKIKFGVEEVRGMRAIIEFPRDFKDVLILSMPSPASCLHVLDGGKLELPRSAGGLVTSIAGFSDISLIDPSADARVPPKNIFGEEPADSWCFYYQKASLARQKEDWETVVRLGEEVKGLSLKPNDRSEWMPFLEGYVNMGEDDTARDIANLIRAKEPIRHALCDRMTNQYVLDPNRYAFLESILCEF